MDEDSRVEDALYYAVLPMLVSNGSVWLLSTPNGKRGFFLDLEGVSGQGAAEDVARWWFLHSDDCVFPGSWWRGR